jgi:hypothetical protein
VTLKVKTAAAVQIPNRVSRRLIATKKKQFPIIQKVQCRRYIRLLRELTFEMMNEACDNSQLQCNLMDRIRPSRIEQLLQNEAHCST